MIFLCRPFYSSNRPELDYKKYDPGIHFRARPRLFIEKVNLPTLDISILVSVK